MLFIVIPLGIVILAGISYVAISRKSGFMLRIAALAALGVMIISVVICLLLVFGFGAAPKTAALPDAPPPENPLPAGSGSAALVFFIVFLVALFLVVFLLSMREQRKAAQTRSAGGVH
ncbi:MAG: hypothetical protein LBD48_03750 [Treponema sp.]|jgi:ABC-type Na+ efflux pump permease subunit|nr:hypothetical protein [Treponema sp.]